MPLPLNTLIAAVLIVGLSGCTLHADFATGAPLNGIQTYESYDRSWALAYPIDWEVVSVQTRPDGTSSAAITPSGDEELLVATKDFGSQPLTLEAIHASVQEDYGNRLHESAITALNGQDAVRVVADTVAGDQPVRLLQYLVPDGSRLYYLTLRAHPAAFGDKQPDLEAIAASFRLR